jgi:hypothetical protein
MKIERFSISSKNENCYKSGSCSGATLIPIPLLLMIIPTPKMTCAYISVAAYVIANRQGKADYCSACCLRLEAQTV